MTDGTVIIPAYVDEAGAKGLVRNLTPERDLEFGVMCAVLFEPDGHQRAIDLLTPSFEEFRQAMPAGAKLHITDAFSPGNESWRLVAERVRAEYIRLILDVVRPMIVYAARRCRLSREAHIQSEDLKKAGAAGRRSLVKVVGAGRDSDARIEDDLILSLTLRLDAFAEDMASQIHEVKQVDLLFDEIDLADRYEATIQRTREISENFTVVKGWDPVANKRVEGSIAMKASAPFRLDTKFLGGIHVVGKEDPLVFAADIIANHLAHHLNQLPAGAPLNLPSSIDGWLMQPRVWGVDDNATEDLY